MGCASSDQNQRVQIKVATLNYSGILKSPYEFYEKHDEDEIKLSRIMDEILQQNSKKFVHSYGPLDKDWQQNRYAPIYNPTCGIKDNIFLMNIREFQEKWDAVKDQNLDYLKDSYNKYQKDKKKKNQECAELEFYLKNMKMFDLITYQAILERVYFSEQKHRSKEEFRQKLASSFDELKLDFKDYREYQKKKFRKSFLDEKKKIDITIKAIKDMDLDIVFFQEADLDLIKAIEQRSKNLRIVKSTDQETGKLSSQSIIVIRENQKKFPKFKSLLEENMRLTNNIKHLRTPNCHEEYLTAEQIKDLNLNNDTVIQFFYNIILICPHLSSKKKVNEQQIEILKKKLKFLKEKFPECHIILGGDLNNTNVAKFRIQAVESEDIISENNQIVFNVVPKCKKYYTSKKKRTFLQAQQDKSHKKNEETKDYIISDLEIIHSQIKTIDGHQIFNCTPSPLDHLEPIKLDGNQSQKKIEQDKQKKQKEQNQPTNQNKKDQEDNQNKQGKQGQKIQSDKKVDDKRKDWWNQPQQEKLNLLPSQEHPYDHYLLIATLVAPHGLCHVTDIEYRFKYKPNQLSHEDLQRINRYHTYGKLI